MSRWLRTGRFRRRLLFFREEEGQGLAEYALIAVMIALACVAALTGLGSAIANSAGFTSLPMSL